MNEAASKPKKGIGLADTGNLGDRPSYYWFDYYSITECIIRYFDHYQFDDCDQHFTDHPVYQISVGIHYVSKLVLITTMFRLGLNLSSTRLILTKEMADT